MYPKAILTILFFTFLIFSPNCQNSNRKSVAKGATKNDQNFLMSIVNTILGGPSDAPILSRIMNKISHIATVLLGSVFAYFKWFRQRKNRNQKINEFIGEEKHKFAIDAQAQMNKIGEKVAQKIIYELNSQKSRQIAVKSNNGTVNFNISIEVEDVQEESILIYNISMRGSDPKGKSKFTGFVTFKDKLLQIRVEQTYDNIQKKEQIPICLFEGTQLKDGESLAQGVWWIDGQRNTQGEHCGTWTFSY